MPTDSTTKTRLTGRDLGRARLTTLKELFTGRVDMVSVMIGLTMIGVIGAMLISIINFFTSGR